MRTILAVIAAALAVGTAPAQTVQVVDPYSLYAKTGKDGSLWYVEVAKDGTEVGIDAGTWLAAYKRPGGAVTALSFPGATYSYAESVGDTATFIGGTAYTTWDAAGSRAVRWNTATGRAEAVTYAQALPLVRRPQFTYMCDTEAVADDGMAVVWLGADNRALWRPSGELVQFPDLSGVIGPDWYIWSVFSVQADGPGTYTVRLVAVHPTLPYTGFIISGLAF